MCLQSISGAVLFPDPYPQSYLSQVISAFLLSYPFAQLTVSLSLPALLFLQPVPLHCTPAGVKVLIPCHSHPFEAVAHFARTADAFLSFPEPPLFVCKHLRWVLGCAVSAVDA